jgi:hypothetical protein
MVITAQDILASLSALSRATSTADPVLDNGESGPAVPFL